ncbi:hypothetical protein CMI44_01530 [Candidatus Pacearchaeota archaeon]|nr:hypothetical protein [Candidatus Pacearchaeota archaeon]|tara:strand:+ start:93 stop:383 length:291 start_codon:yes stop_codon:yes gene_type:complete
MEISDKKKDKICEQILSVLYSVFPKPIFTINIADEVARDEEFIKKLLLNLKSKNLIIEIKKNPKGIPYLRRSRWKLKESVYDFYKNKSGFSNTQKF